jgi:predicted acyltransferase
LPTDNARAATLNAGQAITTGTARLASVDAYRGLVMLLMLAEVLRSYSVAAAVPDSRLWGLVCKEQTHAPWLGCTLHDLIQPSFFLLVGLGVHLSVARRSRTQNGWELAGHVALRKLNGHT